MSRSQHGRRRRGSILITTVVILVLLTVVAAGVIRYSNQEMDNVASKTHYDQAVSCAEGARGLLMSQFRATGVDLTQLTLNQVVGNRRYATGHYDTFGMKTVEGAVAGSGSLYFDITNRDASAALNGRPYRVTVVCSNSTTGGQQSEVEFLIQFGL